MFYFLPFDSNIDEVDDKGISTLMFADVLKRLRAQRALLIIDACQAGGAIESLARVADLKIRVEEQRRNSTLQSARAPGGGVHLIAATMPLSYAVGIGADLSALAQALLEAFQTLTGPITASALTAYTRARVPALSKQTTNGAFEQIPLVQSVGVDFPLLESGKHQTNSPPPRKCIVAVLT